MDIVSIHCQDGSLAKLGGLEFTTNIDKTGLTISVSKTFSNARMRVPFAGATLTHLNTARSAGKAALGAVAGGLLLGPAGALVGGALGAGQKHSLVLHSPGARVVFEASTSDLQYLAGLGLLPTDDPPPPITGRLPKFSLTGTAILLLVIAAVVLFVKAPKVALGLAVCAVGFVICRDLFQRRAKAAATK